VNQKSVLQIVLGVEHGLTRFYRVLMYQDIWVYLCAMLSVFLLGADIPFDRVLREDAYNFVVKALEIAHGDFSLDRTQAIGWPLMLGAVFYFLDVSDLFEAMFIARWTSITITGACVLVLGKLCVRIFGREGFFGLVIAIVLAFIFAPRTAPPSFNALAEPLFLLCALVMTGLLVKAFATDQIRLGYTALAAAVSAVAYYVRPYGLFLFAAMVLVCLLVSRKNRRELVTVCALAAGVFLVVTLPYLYARYAAFGSMFDYGSNSKYFVAHYEYVWADNVPAPSFWQYLKTHDWMDYYWKFIHEGLFVVLYYLQEGLLSGTWIALSMAGAVTIFWVGRQTLYFAPMAVLASIMGMSVIFHVYGSIRHLLYLVPFLLITAGAFFFVLDRSRFGIKNIVGTCMIAFVITTAPGIDWLKPEQVAVAQIKDHWAVWAAENLRGNVAIVEGGDLLEMSQHYESKGWRIAKEFQSVEPRINTIRPGVYRDLSRALEEFKQRNIRYLITDDNHIRRRPYLKDVSNEEWNDIFRHLKHFRLGDKGAVLKGVNIYEVVFPDSDEFRLSR
jgi:hypothetical protein